MAQYSSGNVPGPGTVVSGTSLENFINELIDAFNSGSEGTSTPGNAAKGMIWSKSVSGAVEIYCYTGTTNVLMGTVDLTGNVFEVEESAIDATLTSSGRGVPTGTIIMHGASTAPTGYIKCNGAAVSRTTYAALFAEIGTTYGVGNGSTTFNLPDFRGEFLRGWDDGRGVDSGRTFGSAQAQAIQSHDHAAGTLGGTAESAGAHTHTIGSNVVNAGSTGNVFQGGTGGLLITTTTTSSAGAHAHNLDITGSTAATGGSETRPRNIATLFCIKF